MPTMQVNGAELYYEDTGGDSKEALVFSHGLLWSGRMFDAQVVAFKDRYRCITYDHRGQGRSQVTPAGYDMETVYADAAALIGALNAAPCHFVGLSMGGFVGMRLAARRPELIQSLILVETTADPEPEANIPRYRLLNFVARWLSLGLVVNSVMQVMFGQKFLNDPARTAQRDEMRRSLAFAHRPETKHALGWWALTVYNWSRPHTAIRLPLPVCVGKKSTPSVPRQWHSV